MRGIQRISTWHLSTTTRKKVRGIELYSASSENSNKSFSDPPARSRESIDGIATYVSFVMS